MGLTIPPLLTPAIPSAYSRHPRAGGDPEADGPALRTSSPRRRGSITLFRTTEERTGNHPPFPYTERQTTRTAITCSTVLMADTTASDGGASTDRKSTRLNSSHVAI